MSEITAFLWGVYAGVGIVAGVWVYVVDDPLLDGSAKVRALRSVIVGVMWIVIALFAAGSIINDELQEVLD